MTDYPILNGLIYATIGIAVFAVAFSILSKLMPFDLWKEIAHEHNVAAAVFAGAVALGLCWIIAATMH
jgi:putative membrane protein